jgi:AcrR family transcriptional regulator
VASDTKERILDSSGELFRRQGYVGTGVKQIVEEAGAPFGSLYHFFPGGKEELGAETIRRSGALYGLLLGEFVGPDVELVRGVGDFFAGAAETLVETDYADACPIATVALEVSSSNEELRTACADVFIAWIDGGVERFAAEGIPRKKARELAIQMLAALEGAFVLSRALRSTEPVERAGAAAAAAVQAAIPAQPSTAVQRVAELHRRQGEMYAGGSVDPVAELLAQDIVWHVLGNSAIAGSHRGIGQVLDYFQRRRELANATMRMHPREVISDGEAVVQLVDGSARIGGETVSWRTTGIYRVDEHWIREVWLVPLDVAQFDRIWAGSK